MPLLPDVSSCEAHTEIDELCVDAVGHGTVPLFSQASAAVKLAAEFEESRIDVVVTAWSSFFSQTSAVVKLATEIEESRVDAVGIIDGIALLDQEKCIFISRKVFFERIVCFLCGFVVLCFWIECPPAISLSNTGG